MSEFREKWCLVTGASSGIGAEFARQLAASGARLVLVARREERLNALADELRTAHNTESRVIAMDLLKPGATANLRSQTEDLEIDVLINNAGFGHYGQFTDMDIDRATNMVQLNICLLYTSDAADE